MHCDFGSDGSWREVTLGYPQDVVYTVQEKAWNDIEMMNELIE